jgi:serine-type D-Ala-D-Ala carboxypeptidase (penicillin-binding protein 5/6)
MNDTPRIVKERRVVIMFQIAILAFILVGLFSAYLNGRQQTAAVTDSVDLKTAPLKENQKEIPKKVSEVEVRGKAAYVWDVKNQRALYAKNADTALPLASITKLMTALLAHDLINDNQKAVVSDRAVRQEGSNGLMSGENISFEELNKLALVSSSNDAAYALAANTGALLGDKDPAAQFVKGMNIKADDLKLKTLLFKNTTGLDLSSTEAGAIGSAHDVSLLLQYILKTYPEILTPTTKATGRAYSSDGTYHDLENTNEIVYAIPNLLGSKTGYTDLAGGNLTIAFDAGMNRPIIITVLGSARDERFSDVLRLVKAIQRNINDI